MSGDFVWEHVSESNYEAETLDTKSALITPFYCLVVETYPSGTLRFPGGTSLLFGMRVDQKGGIKPGFGMIYRSVAVMRSP
jgi:hypothetical protein